MTSSQTLTAEALIQHEAFVLRLARGLTQDDASARDLAQDTLLSALRNPPEVKRLRGWFSAVVRNRVAERRRTESRRKTREAATARPEAQALASAPLEQLELNQSVVQAVLALDEPYRAVVIGVYYEGLTPAALAARGTASAGTIRSQLSRALDQLKGKLDAEHGKREVWSMPLAGLCAVEGLKASAGGAATTATTHTLWPWFGAAASFAVVGLWVMAQGAAVPASREGGVSIASLGTGAAESLRAREAPAPAAKPHASTKREPIAAAAPSQAATRLPALTTVASMLERVRQIKVEILDRALAVAPEDRARFDWLDGEPDAGVIRMLERSQFGANLSLPWLREGGSYFSFSEGVHDFNRRPQISLEQEHLRFEGRENAGLDLGTVPLDSIAARPTWKGQDLGPVRAAEFALAWTAIDESHPDLNSLQAHRVQVAAAASEDTGVSDDEARSIARGGRAIRGLPRVGHSYLLRTRSSGEYDVLVAFEVVRVDPRGCTLAWRTLKTWPVEEQRRVWKPRMLRSELAESPAILAGLSDAELRHELTFALAAADVALFQTFPPGVASRFGRLRGEAGSGLARLLPYMGPWSELRDGGASGSTLSPLTGGDRGNFTYLGFQGSGRSATLHPGLDGGVYGIVADIGKIELETVTRASAKGLGGAAGDIALNHRLERIPYEPNRPGFDQEMRELSRENRASFRAKRSEHGLHDSATAVVGRTYLVRAIRERDRDILFAVHVAEMDEYGAIVAWRVLESEVVEPLR